MNQVREALDALKGLGTPEQLRDATAAQPAPVNAHIHLPPNFSAFETVQQAVDLAASQGVKVLGVSNYYDYDVYGDFVARARAAGIFPLFGLEIILMDGELRDARVKVNDPGNPGKFYLCGKGITRFDEMTPRATELLDKIRKADEQRMVDMIDALEKVFVERGQPTGLDEAKTIDMVVRRHGSPRQTVYLQERHIAQAFQEALFVKVDAADRLDVVNTVLGGATKATDPDDHTTIQKDIRSALMKAGKPAFVDESFISFDEACELILELGGIPAYPTLADGASPICEFEKTPAALIDALKSRGLHAAEFIPIRNAPDVMTEYVTAMRQAGLVITAGTEHNTPDLIPIEPQCLKGADVPDRCKAIFWEGACVVAAHQHLTLHGEPGFVDAQGQPNADYADAESRIAAFARLGAAVIQRYFDQSC